MSARQPRPAVSFAARSKRWTSSAARPEPKSSQNAQRDYERYLAHSPACRWRGIRPSSGLASLRRNRVTPLGFRTIGPHLRLSAASRWRCRSFSAKLSGRSVVVRINDRGPFIRSRAIDVTPAARALGFSGLAPVHSEPLGAALSTRSLFFCSFDAK